MITKDPDEKINSCDFSICRFKAQS